MSIFCKKIKTCIFKNTYSSHSMRVLSIHKSKLNLFHARSTKLVTRFSNRLRLLIFPFSTGAQVSHRFNLKSLTESALRIPSCVSATGELFEKWTLTSEKSFWNGWKNTDNVNSLISAISCAPRRPNLRHQTSLRTLPSFIYTALVHAMTSVSTFFFTFRDNFPWTGSGS